MREAAQHKWKWRLSSEEGAQSHTPLGTDIRAKKFCLQPDSLMSLEIAKVFAST